MSSTRTPRSWATLLPRAGEAAEYVLDLGDEWRHRIRVEQVHPAQPDRVYPVCAAGSGLAPEEDTGYPRGGGFGEQELGRVNERLTRRGPGHSGRDLLVARFGEAARAWGPRDFQSRNLSPWDQWVKSLDAARFGQTEPPFPSPLPLVAALDARGDGAVKP